LECYGDITPTIVARRFDFDRASGENPPAWFPPLKIKPIKTISDKPETSA